jgi:geranylgeranyl diphosphate synthase type I
MEIREKLNEFKNQLDPEIEKYLDKTIKEVQKEDIFITDALRFVKKYVLSGGKRLRPALMYYGYLAAGGKEKEKAIQTSVSIELIHAFLLIHDDIIDKDNMRHGVDTAHFHFSKIGKKYFPKKDNAHFGNSIAIIVGDMVGAMGNQIIFNSEFEPKNIIKALDRLQGIVSMTVIGQSQDIYIEYAGKASEKEILRMYKNKTAKYTIEGPLHLGAILGGADVELLESISRFSIPIGIAFQIQDDILGIFGSEKKIGKPVGSDIAEGKQTILVARALETGSAAQKKAIKNLLGKAKLTGKDIDEFRRAIIASGSLEYAQKTANDFIRQGKAEIKKSKIAGEAQEFLLGIADYMASREV